MTLLDSMVVLTQVLTCSDTRAKSCTGCMIILGGCPILWKSQLQTEVSQSKIGIWVLCSQCKHKNSNPMHDLLERSSRILEPPDFKPTICCCVLEDNNAPLLRGTNNASLIEPSSYVLIKWHFFLWHHVCSGDIECSRVQQQTSQPIT